MKEIDARGLACPAPVLQAKAAVEQEGASRVKVFVDNEAAQQNVKRFLASKGFSVELGRSGDDFVVDGTGDGEPAAEEAPIVCTDSDLKKILVMCSADRMGTGDDDLGRALMVNFLKTLEEMGPELWRLVFVNSGVKLTVEGSAVTDVLQGYEKTGLTILVCGTCLNHFHLLEKKKVGATTNMLDIITSLQLADKVINL
ncbi:MAG: sulfurtransferase-like selenium metabolism protein YedF [Desulfobacterales bacterium]|jgi:selenium metabolism protein YedF